MKKAIFLSFLFLASTSFAQFAPLEQHYNTLSTWRNGMSATEKATFDSGRAVIRTQNVTGNANAIRVFLFKKLDASPEEVAAVMSDYALHKNFLEGGNLTQSDIVTRHNATSDRVAYTLVLRAVDVTERYQIDSSIAARNGGVYRADRLLAVRGRYLKTFESTAKIEPNGPGKSIVSYYSLIDTGRRSRDEEVRTRTAATVLAVETQVKKEKAENPNMLSNQITTLRARFR